MTPYLICHMITTVDGSILIDDFSTSPDGNMAQWIESYMQMFKTFNCDAWIVGRVSMEEMNPSTHQQTVHSVKIQKPISKGLKTPQYCIVLDSSGKLSFESPTVNGDAIIVLLGSKVNDSHLSELTACGVSYIISDTDEINLKHMLELLHENFGIKRAGLMGGSNVNGTFISAGLVNEISVVIAPSLSLSGNIKPLIGNSNYIRSDKLNLELKNAETLSDGLVRLNYNVKH
ncbi:RibD family protein [Pectobacterium aroidearum]|uniref:dihydrofolate reductase family protein n=1 Tax=Pectobacterium aroidearum TaxID=1201031 RepID=UPI0015F7570F|nr:RibD family protein [Pectobacterium aroidearum]MBA5602049.1 RibD family protein [Pectobacterium aroidearum]